MFEAGAFFTGCNYWASHAGTNMWHDWDEAVVEADLARLSKENIRVLRIFPMWSDFQPIKMHRRWSNVEVEVRMGEDPLPFTEEGRAGIDPVMVARFETFCDLAQKYHLQLIVGLVTGWMSGRMHVPAALEGRNLITDPLVVRWQLRFVRYMVKRFKHHSAIAAWDLGNECNCLQETPLEENYRWTALITDAIKREDAARPVISGLHGNLPDGAWRPQDLGELLDVLCTHPYPLFTPYCNTDPLNEMKSVLHATAETVMYESLSGKPAFIEEAGNLGPMVADEAVSGDYARASAFSAWAHGLHGYLWWCAHEQNHLTHTPYDWNGLERELGLFRSDFTPKPVLKSLADLASFVDAFPYGKMPERICDAVCVLTENGDTWATAYGTFLLAKQAGVDIRFAWCHDEIPEAQTYLLPSLNGGNPIYHHELQELLCRVEKGATLYLSLGDALLPSFCEMTGVRVKTRCSRTEADKVPFGDTEFSMWNDTKFEFVNERATVLAQTETGSPAFTVIEYGKGKIYFMAYPIEITTGVRGGILSGEHPIPYYRFYEALHIRSAEKMAKSEHPCVGVTEHIVNENLRLLPILNHTPKAQTAKIALKDGWHLCELLSYCGGEANAEEDGFTVSLPENVGVVAVIQK